VAEKVEKEQDFVRHHPTAEKKRKRGGLNKLLLTQVVAVAALVPVHRTSFILSDAYRFLDPSGTSVRLHVRDCRCRPVGHVVMLACMVCQGKFCHVTSLPWQEQNKLLLTNEVYDRLLTETLKANNVQYCMI